MFPVIHVLIFSSNEDYLLWIFPSTSGLVDLINLMIGPHLISNLQSLPSQGPLFVIVNHLDMWPMINCNPDPTLHDDLREDWVYWSND